MSINRMKDGSGSLCEGCAGVGGGPEAAVAVAAEVAVACAEAQLRRGGREAQV